MPKEDSVCFSCGKRVELPPKEPPCKVLSGWLAVSKWKGPGAVEHYEFCSFICLKRWVEAQIPAIPQAFLDSFEEESGGSDAYL